MKKIFALSIAVLVFFTGCGKRPPDSDSSLLESSPPESSSRAQSSSATAQTPEGAAEILLNKISNLDKEQIEELAKNYLAMDEVPDAYYSILKPITERISYKVGASRIDGSKAMVDVSVTSVDAKSAFNSVMPGAVAHLAALQIAGKDISNPEIILAEYAANNIKWDELPTIKTNSTLYMIKGADNNWKVDVSDQRNLDFANAVSGGAIEMAQSLKSFAERFQ